MFSSSDQTLFQRNSSSSPTAQRFLDKERKKNERSNISRLALAGQSHATDKVISGLCQDSKDGRALPVTRREVLPQTESVSPENSNPGHTKRAVLTTELQKHPWLRLTEGRNNPLKRT